MRQRFIQSFSTSGDVQTAIDGGQLGKPYVAYIEDGKYIDWNSKEAVIDYTSMYLTFKIISGGTITWNTNNVDTILPLEYQLNDNDWVEITPTTGGTVIDVAEGDSLRFRGDNQSYGTPHTNYFGGSAVYEIMGNIMSLTDSVNFPAFSGGLETQFTFNGLFKNCSGLTSAENLVLPATACTKACYSGMFDGCRSLTKAPSLPATVLGNGSYNAMFAGCVSLTEAPALPAMDLSEAWNCYMYMFSGCTSLTQAPVLPATALGASCYESMFRDCTSLVTAPELPVEVLAGACYYAMFRGCVSLNYIKCLATDMSAETPLNNWVRDVAATGTFVKHPNAAWETGRSGIPAGWTVIDADI